MDPLQLTEAAVTRLEGDSRYGLYQARVHDTPPDAYVIMYPDGGFVQSDRLGGGNTKQTWELRVICVGRTVKQVMNTVAIIRSKLTGVHLDPAKSASQLREIREGAQILPSENTDQTDVRLSYTLHWRMTNTRS